MFNTLYPKVYQRLRERADLTQVELATLLGMSRYTVINVERGSSRLDESQERRLLEIARCSREEFCELVCQLLSALIEKPVGIQEDHGAYQPSTALSRAHALLRAHEAEIPTEMRRALNNRISTTQLMGLAFDKNNADLVELTQDCRDQLS